MSKIVIGILSYNNPSYTDRLYFNLKSVLKTECDIIVFDNGSDIDKISQFTTHRIENNCRMTCGFNHIIQAAMNSNTNLEYIWFFTNDCFFETSIDPLHSMISSFEKYPKIGILHPALSKNVKVCYDIKHIDRGGIKIVCEYDFVCPMFSRKALDAIGNEFTKEFYFGWGMDHESSYLVRKNGMKVAINHDLVVMHNTSTTYNLGLDSEFQNSNEYYTAAGLQMIEVMTKKYGHNWNQLFTQNYNEEVGIWYE